MHAITINEKEGHEFGEEWEWAYGNLEGEKRREKCN